MSDQCNCRQCLRDRNEENPHGSGWPTELTMMIVCKTCGDKRCPHAIDHRNECTGSNKQKELVEQLERSAQEPSNTMNDHGLLDDEGENQAVRYFLLAYGGGNLTLDRMMAHMKACGYPLWPEWVETTDMRGHLTKAGAQLWLRHLFGLEATDRIAKLEAAARALIERLDTPLWKDVPATGNYINALRKVLGDGNDAQVP